MDLTTVGLCKSIYYNMGRVPQPRMEELTRLYEITWMIVYLHYRDLATPTKDARARLEDFYDVVRRETPDQRMVRPS